MKKVLLSLILLTSVLALIFTGSCRKDDHGSIYIFEPFINPSDHQTTRIESNLPRIVMYKDNLMVFLSVTDQNQRPLIGLNKMNFKIEKVVDGVTTPIYDIEVFGGGVGTPGTIGAALTLDYSGSMYYDSTDVPNMETAVKYFINHKGIGDYCELIKFSSNVYVVTPFTTNDTLLLQGVDDSTYNLKQATAFYQSCLVGLEDADSLTVTHPTLLPAVIGFTDGVNNIQPLDPDSVVSRALSMQIPVYTIGYGNYSSYPPDTNTLKYIADTTGGRFYWTPNTSDLQQLYQYVSGQLTNMYVITFPFGTKDNALIRITTTYECANGTFTTVAQKMIYY
ncbi:MAG: VWA domain-containing protein [Bacteroidales bacterium]|nr:VWA domain-containing protein [Bacteroidales bacterium]